MTRTSLYVYSLLMLLLLLLAGCAPLPVAPTPEPIPTNTFPAATPSPTSPPVASQEPTIHGRAVPLGEVTDLPTLAPTITNDPQQAETPLATPIVPLPVAIQVPTHENTLFGEAEINILRPGQLSNVISPVYVVADLTPSANVKIALIGEDGREISSKLLRSYPYEDAFNGNIVTELDFTLPGLVETGRLVITITDEFGRVSDMNSVDLILLSTGINNRNYAPQNLDRVILQLPQPEHLVQGDTMLVSGLVRPFSDEPLTIWLIDEKGLLVGDGVAPVVAVEGESYSQFVGQVNIRIQEPTWVRLLVCLPGGRVPGFAFIKSIELVVNP